MNGYKNTTQPTFENALEPVNANLMRAAEDDDEFAETFRQVSDGLCFSGARRTDQRCTRNVGGCLRQCYVAPVWTPHNNNIKPLILCVSQ